MRIFNHSPKTIAYSDKPFPAIRYSGGPRPTLLLPVGSKKLVDEAGTLSEGIRLEACAKGGHVAVPSKKPAPGALHLARHSGGQVEIIAGAEHIFAEARCERPEGPCTELVCAAYLRGDQRLVVKVRNRVGDTDGATFTYTVDGCDRQPFHEAPLSPANTPDPRPEAAARGAAGPQPLRLPVRVPRLVPVLDGPLGYAHVTTLADGRPVWVALAGLTYAVGADPRQGDVLDAGALGELLPGRPTQVAPAAYALAVTSMAAQRHAAEA